MAAMLNSLDGRYPARTLTGDVDDEELAEGTHFVYNRTLDAVEQQRLVDSGCWFSYSDSVSASVWDYGANLPCSDPQFKLTMDTLNILSWQPHRVMHVRGAYPGWHLDRILSWFPDLIILCSEILQISHCR